MARGKMESTGAVRWVKIAVQVLLLVAIILGGLYAAKYFNDTKPVVRRSKPEKTLPLVDVVSVGSRSISAVVHAMGTVIPSRQLSLYPQLSGTVDWISPAFHRGGRVLKGEILVEIDKEDYELEVKRQESLIRQLRADIDLEEGKQEVAKKEIELMKKTTGKILKNPNLALRVPQMNRLVASLQERQLVLEQARLNLQRTTIRSPFNAVVLERFIEQGSKISTQNPLATLVGTDAYWIETSVPVDKLKWIDIPNSEGRGGSPAKVRLQDGSFVSGTVIRLLGNIDQKSQMAKILVQVKDPLGKEGRSGRMPLLLNSFVSLDIVGSRIPEVVEIPRKVVKEGNRVWVFEKGRLKIRTINPVWEDEKSLYVQNNIKSGEMIVTSEMSTVVDGMAARRSGIGASGGRETKAAKLAPKSTANDKSK